MFVCVQSCKFVRFLPIKNDKIIFKRFSKIHASLVLEQHVSNYMICLDVNFNNTFILLDKNTEIQRLTWVNFTKNIFLERLYFCLNSRFWSCKFKICSIVLIVYFISNFFYSILNIIISCLYTTYTVLHFLVKFILD